MAFFYLIVVSATLDKQIIYIYRFLMLTSIFPITHAAANAANKPAVIVKGFRRPSHRV